MVKPQYKNITEYISVQGEPVIVTEQTYKFCLGLVTAWWLVEDRRPDLSVEEYKSKYKHQLKVKFLWFNLFSLVFRLDHENKLYLKDN